MQTILKDSEYAFDAANKEITLVAPYDALSLGQVTSITNLTTKDLIYASDIRGQPARSSCTETGCPISIAAAVITHTYANPSQADTDKLQIIIDTVPAVTISDTGTTVNAYADSLDWPCSGFSNKNIHLKNTDGANALKYKVLTYAYAGGLPYEEVAETILAIGDTAQIILQYAYAAVKVQVKSSVGDSHATYQLDYDGDS